MVHIKRIDEMQGYNHDRKLLNESEGNIDKWYVSLEKLIRKTTIGAAKNKEENRFGGESNQIRSQSIEVLVDSSSNTDPHLLEGFFNRIAGLCAKYEFSAMDVIPYGKKVDYDNELRLTFDEVNDESARNEVVTKCVKTCMNSDAYGNGDLTIDGCVDGILEWSRTSTQKEDVWIVFTDGEFDPRPLKKLSKMRDKVMFVVCNRGTDHLEWYNDPDYDDIQKCYIDIDHIV